MLVKALGLIDIFAGFILILEIGVKLPSTLFLILGIILLSKSLLGLLKDIGSWIDLSCGIVLVLSSLVTMPIAISIIFGILILQKGVVSFL